MGGWGKLVLFPVDIYILKELIAVEASQMNGNTNVKMKITKF